jgi:putative membrane protein
LEQDGRKQIFYPKSNDGWIRSLFVLEGRALDKIMLPWILVSLNAIVWTLVAELYLKSPHESNLSSYANIFGLILSSALSFLLIFRLNRSAERFWMARKAWGTIIASSRSIAGGIIVHGRHNPKQRDEVIRWIVAFNVALMHYMRGIRTLHRGTLLGVLNEDEIRKLEGLPHPPVHTAERIRRHLNAAFHFADNTPIPIAQARRPRLYPLENQLNILILEMSALERIHATPLPLVYVTHLRTFLLCFLLAVPYIWERNLGYATIPIVIMTAYALLGLEGTAMEVEAPFKKDRPNHLNMDAFCLLVLKNIVQEIQQEADNEIAAKQPVTENDESSELSDAEHPPELKD